MLQDNKSLEKEDLEIKNEQHINNEIAVSMHYKEINDLKIEKIETRVTIISIIIPCLIVIILLFAYFDIKERVINVQSTGENKVKIIAEDIEAKLNKINLDITEFKKFIAVKLPEITKNLKKSQKNVTVNKKNISTINKTEKLFKKKLNNFENDIQKNISPLNDLIQTNLSNIKMLIETLTKYQQELAFIQIDISVTQKQLKQILQNQIKKDYINKQISILKNDFNKKTRDLYLELAKIEQKFVKNTQPNSKSKVNNKPESDLKIKDLNTQNQNTKINKISEKNISN
ncbi:MAG: hypothetical protein B6I26_02020 [Desulfobacteraceae bacterium 4572_130]|nr:MAG: hypothetical protein B6I26_02020 [Desulfobacteraceae bacterium 4572_130]